MLTSTLLEVTLVKHISIPDKLDQCEVTMSDLSTYTVFDNFNELNKYLGKRINYTTRKDVVNGVVTDVLNNFTVVSVVQVSSEDDRFDDIPLMSGSGNIVSICNFEASTFKRDDFVRGAIVFVSEYSMGKSSKARWVDFTCLDKHSIAFNLRLFSNIETAEEIAQNFIGRYVVVDIKHTSYGLQVDGDMCLCEQEVIVSPEVTRSKTLLQRIVDKDEELKGYVDKYNMLDFLEHLIYFEPGYQLVVMYSEVILINSLCKIFNLYNKKLLYRSVFASRGYLVSSSINISHPLVNYHRIITSTLKGDTDLINLLDINNGIDSADYNKNAYLAIKKFVNFIVKGRYGVVEENVINSMLDSIDAEFGGLFKK